VTATRGLSPRTVVARLRPVLPPAGVLVIVVDATGVLPWPALDGVGLVGMGLLLLFMLADRVAPPPAPLRVVERPVTGPWRALNSPATKVPSHGTHSLGQTHALDLVLDPPDGSRPEFGSGTQWRRPDEYPAFGAPVTSPVTGTVVRVHDRRRDHRARSGWVSLVYMLVVEGFVRQLGGARWMTGNVVVVRADDGTHVVLAHLRRGSALVRPGDRATAGRQLAECGNSGNSSEPHLHVQLTDTLRIAGACGVPMAFRGGAPDGGAGLPANGELLAAH